MLRSGQAPISIRKLFLVIIVLKLAASASGWLLGSPWILGFSVPLGLMSLYIVLGLTRGDHSVSDEKFADSCYYLGFIFTISSILVALLDLPSIEARLADISIRFGAAMVSTVLGLIVRVYLVNFALEFPDAVRDAEVSLLDAARAFRTHLDVTVDKLREFQITVDDAAQSAIARVDMAMQDAAVSQEQRFVEKLDALAAEHRRVAEESVTHLKAATQSLATAMYDYSGALAGGVDKFENSAAQITVRLEDRIRRVALPEDFFATRLDPPAARLGQTLAEAGAQMSETVAVLQAGTREIGAALTRIREQAEAIGRAVPRDSLSGAGSLELMAALNTQAAALAKLAGSIERLEQAVAGRSPDVLSQARNAAS